MRIRKWISSNSEVRGNSGKVALGKLQNGNHLKGQLEDEEAQFHQVLESVHRDFLHTGLCPHLFAFQRDLS